MLNCKIFNEIGINFMMNVQVCQNLQTYRSYHSISSFLCKTFWFKNESTCCFLQFTRLIKYLPTLHGVNWKSFQNRLYNFYSSSLGLDITVSCKKVILIFRITIDDDKLMRYKFLNFKFSVNEYIQLIIKKNDCESINE